MTQRFTAFHAILALLISMPGILHAQSPRKILIEAFTNMECGPCGEEYPIFDRYVAQPRNRADVIPVSYHANFPGPDEMRDANPAMHDGRNGYYGIGGIPTLRINGRSGSRPGDTAGLTATLAPWHGLISPITITIDQTRHDGRIDGKVTVTSTTPLYGKRLYIVAVQRMVHLPEPSENGEQDYANVARLMFPDVEGAELGLEPGQSAEFDASYTPAPGWNPDDMYFVAFIQSPVTHDVIQAATNQGAIGFSSATTTSAVQKGEEGLAWSGTVAASVAGRYHVAIGAALPDAWDAGVTIGGASVRDGDSISLPPDAAIPIDVTITPGNGLMKSRKGTVTVVLDGPRGSHLSTTFTAYAKGATAIILRRDEGIAELESYYQEALEMGDVPYAIVDYQDRDLFTLKDYPVALYAYGSRGPTARDVTDLKEYLDGGGRLLVAGAMVSFDLAGRSGRSDVTSDTLFLRDYLHAGYVTTISPSKPLTGRSGDPIGDGLSIGIRTWAQNVYVVLDVITPLDGGIPVFHHDSPEKVTGVRYAGPHGRMVYLTFGIESIADAGERSEVLKRSIAWLLSTPAAVPADAGESTMLEEPRPNPSTGSVTIPFRLARGGRVSIALYNARGELVAPATDATFEAGSHAVGLAPRHLPSGIYTIVMSADGKRSTRMLRLIR